MNDDDVKVKCFYDPKTESVSVATYSNGYIFVLGDPDKRNRSLDEHRFSKPVIDAIERYSKVAKDSKIDVEVTVPARGLE